VQGNFHKLKERMATERPQIAEPRPGGQDALMLTRTRMLEDSLPEFLSVTTLPGRGMNVLQIKAYVPGKGEVDLMASPSVADAAAAMTKKGKDANGQASLAMGGAFEAPWAGRMQNSTWHGRALALPADAKGGTAEGGLLLANAATSSNSTALPDGGQAQATFHGFGDRWPSKTEITVTVLLSSHTVDLTMIARNTGDAPEPVGIGWRPRFSVLNGDRAQMRLRVPAESRVEVRDRQKGLPTGVLLPVAGTPFDLSARDGVRLGNTPLDECFAALQQGLLENGPVAELSDPAGGYKLRMTALSSTIQAMRVIAPAGANFVSIGPQFNYPDPLGHEWEKSGSTGMVVLQPGETTQWKVRLEILPLSGGGGAM
jgi:galactose mutarotase-like enzyme